MKVGTLICELLKCEIDKEVSFHMTQKTESTIQCMIISKNIEVIRDDDKVEIYGYEDISNSQSIEFTIKK